ncbi:hypothetical protein SAMN05444166_2754 [Singulisphaera sp. GP187]|uniref:FG-GAP-like repeat-containing protein n=1 Tax=Singulisphaera sp. GP187 TaxID=1882752 RepID=UPI0009289941|nr:FG-GAP-like repeat-containing protein [Singulisphaera sp. GP187]SIO15893.1 hypothetical protein SAMN05444166_2754 [Singulisphaera sp. GP187]
MSRHQWPIRLTGTILLLLSGASGADEVTALSLSAPQIWTNHWAVGNWDLLAGDADGDGRADLVALQDGDGASEIARTSVLGKPFHPIRARPPFGRAPRAATFGPFTRPGAADLLVVLDDGSVQVASGMAPGTSRFTSDQTAARFPASEIPEGPAHAYAADLDGDGHSDILIRGARGRLHVLINEQGNNGASVRFAIRPVGDLLSAVRQLEVGRFGDDSRASLVWIDQTGDLRRARLRFDAGGPIRLEDSSPLLKAGADDRMAVGRFRGAKTADIILGRRLLVAGDPANAVDLPALPGPEQARGDLRWRMADVDGNGRDDLIRQRSTSDSGTGTGHDVLIHFASLATDPAQGFLSSDGDGLLDAWKSGAVRPGGLDLPALGCKPGRKDLIVEVERFENVDIKLLRAEVDVTVRYFASLPVKNRDGSQGIALHAIYRDPTPRGEFDDVLRRFDARYPPRSHRGVVHTMFCGAPGDPGFGVAKMMGDNGRFTTNPQVQDVMSHELGHQLGLNHDGFQSHNSLTYASMMSYCYQNGFNDRPEEKRFSDGSLGRTALNERCLSERLPLPIKQVAFLNGPPYHFRLRPAGKETLIDWNWNGLFGEEGVTADVNYSHGTDVGPRYEVGRAATAPVLVTHAPGASERLLLIFGRPAPESPRASPDAAGLAPERPGELVLRVWVGKDRDQDGARWSKELTVEQSGVTGDPSAAYAGGATWVAYPTKAGIRLRRVALDPAGNPSVGPATAIPTSQGAEPTLAALGSRLVLLLWRSPDQPIGVRVLGTAGASPTVGREEATPLTSLVPVAATAGAVRKGLAPLWVATMDGPRDGDTRTFIHRLEGRPGKDFRVTGREPIPGSFAPHRPILLWAPERGLGPDGRLFHFGGGTYEMDNRVSRARDPWAQQIVSMQTGAPEWGGGWLHRRYYTQPGQPSEYFMSRSAPGVCGFGGDIAYANRLRDADPARNDTVVVGFYGSGALPEPMGDFDDIGFLSEVGLGHSLWYVAQDDH